MAVNGTFPKSRKQLQVQGFLDLNKFRMNSTEEVFVMGLLSPPPMSTALSNWSYTTKYTTWEVDFFHHYRYSKEEEIQT